MLKLINGLILAYAVLSPYYLFKSGGLQLSSLFMIAAFGIFIYLGIFNKSVKSIINLPNIAHKHRFLIYFVISAIGINALWWIVIPDKELVLSSFYLVFNLLTVLLFSYLSKDSKLLGRIRQILYFNIAVQLFIYISGIGRYYSPDRYMGTFNDPNQLAFYIFISLLVTLIIGRVINKKSIKLDVAIWLTGIYLIYLSSSTGIMFGIATFLVLYVIHNLYRIAVNAHSLKISNVRRFFLLSCLVLPLPILWVYAQYTPGNPTAISAVSESPLAKRLENKASKANGDEDVSLLEDRGLDIIYKYPHYILFGAGAGAYNRYPDATQNNGIEIHSTLSLLFYYGLIPFILLCIWIVTQLHSKPPVLVIAALALLIESLSLVNYRQPMFWIAFVLVGSYLTASQQKASNTRTTINIKFAS